MTDVLFGLCEFLSRTCQTAPRLLGLCPANGEPSPITHPSRVIAVKALTVKVRQTPARTLGRETMTLGREAPSSLPQQQICGENLQPAHFKSLPLLIFLQIRLIFVIIHQTA